MRRQTAAVQQAAATAELMLTVSGMAATWLGLGLG